MPPHWRSSLIRKTGTPPSSPTAHTSQITHHKYHNSLLSLVNLKAKPCWRRCTRGTVWLRTSNMATPRSLPLLMLRMPLPHGRQCGYTPADENASSVRRLIRLELIGVKRTGLSPKKLLLFREGNVRNCRKPEPMNYLVAMAWTSYLPLQSTLLRRRLRLRIASDGLLL